jgi:two-component system phosphate regulon sensor histidine kinase PhoR
VRDSLGIDRPDIGHLNLSLLDFKIREEFRCMKVGDDYEYAIIDIVQQTIFAGKYRNYEDKLLNSPNQVSLTGFNDPDRYVLSAWFPDQRKQILMKLFTWIVISGLFALALIIGFPVSLFIFNRQKKISAMKSDFINNMTHEFKTPIATISLASEMLLKKSVADDQEKLKRYARIIYDENTRLQHHVEQILGVTMLERGQFRLKRKETNVHLLIREAVENFSITIKDRGGQIVTHLNATRSVLNIDRNHITNVITNLLDNANKYSPGSPWISVGTHNTEYGLTITVEDKGVGISLENQRHVFKNLFRVSTGDIYNVKGFGIGLYYVKTIVEAHGGHINLKSELNKGSRFDVYLPFDFKSSKDDQFNQAEDPSR